MPLKLIADFATFYILCKLQSRIFSKSFNYIINILLITEKLTYTENTVCEV